MAGQLVIFIDTGAKACGVGVSRDGAPLAGFLVKKLEAADAEKRIDILTNIIDQHWTKGDPRPILFVEAPWANPARVNAFGSLCEQSVVWEVCAGMCGIKVGERVYPLTWKSAMTDASLRREDGKQASIAACRALWPDAPLKLDDNVAEAVLGAVFCDRRLAGTLAEKPKAKRVSPKRGGGK